MSNQSSLTPKEQQSLFDLLKKSGQQPTSGGLSTDTPDAEAQQGVGNVDAGGIQQLFGSQFQQPNIQQQDGDKMHPMDAIHQIGQQFGPTAPSGVSLATGPQLQNGANGQLQARVPVDQPLLRLLGMKKNVDVSSTNYYDAIKKAGLDKYLPSGLAKMPDGTPFAGPETMQKVLEAKRIMAGQGTELYSTVDQLTSQGIKPEDAKALLAANPNGVTSKEVGTFLSTGRLEAVRSIATTKKGMLDLGRNKFEQTQIDNLIKGISDAKQSSGSPMGQQANKLDAVIHGRQILSGAYNSATGEYDIPPAGYKELVMSLARAVSPSGQLSEKTQEELSSPTVYGNLAGVLQKYTGQTVTGSTQDIIKMYRTMLDRQGAISQDLFNAHAARELPMGLLLKASNPLAYAAVLQNSFGTHDYRSLVANSEDGADSSLPAPINLGGRGTPPAPVSAPRPAAKPTGTWKVIR